MNLVNVWIKESMDIDEANAKWTTRYTAQVYRHNPHLATVSQKSGPAISASVVSNTAASHTHGIGEAGGLTVICFASCLLHTLQFARMARLLFRPLRIQNFSSKRLKESLHPDVAWLYMCTQYESLHCGFTGWQHGLYPKVSHVCSLHDLRLQVNNSL